MILFVSGCGRLGVRRPGADHRRLADRRPGQDSGAVGPGCDRRPAVGQASAGRLDAVVRPGLDCSTLS